jgi:membrane-bound metal-dependent hydrolase YbcI (DUF457 family)
MDILTHTLSGLAVGSLVAGFSRKGFGARTGILLAGGIGGALPDLDAVSLWSKFDTTIGRFFHLPHSGAEIYSGKFWYSHHGFFHSLAAGLLLALLVAAIVATIRARAGKSGLKRRGGIGKPIFVALLCGFVIHLLEDLPTPASDWGGVRLFWPLKTYVGGAGEIWWWNNYDLFLIAAGVLAVGVVLLLTNRLFRAGTKYLLVAVFVFGCVLTTVQIGSRKNDYAYTGHTENYQSFEAASRKEQQRILGDRLYRAMERLDRALPIYF